jgi:hypothetical protein
MSYISNYNFTIKNSIIAQSNVYNIFKSDAKEKITLSVRFNTFKNEKSLKFIRLYNLIFIIGNQRPFLKKVKFNYIKKKILKRFFLNANLNNRNKDNLFVYISYLYLYFFHLYYQNSIKYNYLDNTYIFYVDNIQFFFRNYGKHAQKTQMHITFTSKVIQHNTLFKYLSNFFVVKLKKKL